MSNNDVLLVLRPYGPRHDGTVDGEVVARLTLGVGVIAPSGAKGQFGWDGHTDELADPTWDGRPVGLWEDHPSEGERLRTSRTSDGTPFIPLELKAVCRHLARYARHPSGSEKAAVAHAYLAALRDMRGRAHLDGVLIVCDQQ